MMIFTVADPLNRMVKLKEETWVYKIAPEHPEMRVDILKHVILDPYYILYDLTPDRNKHPSREEYVDLIVYPETTKFVIIRAIVDHAFNPSEIVSAWVSSKTKGLTTEGGVVYVRPNGTRWLSL